MASQILGLALSADALHLALAREGRLVRCAEAPLPAGLIHQGHITDPDALAGHIRQLCRSQGISARRCAFVLPRELVTIRQLTLPSEKIGTISAHFPDHSPEIYEFSHQTAQPEKEQLPLLAAAVRRSDLEQIRAALRKAGLSMALALPREAAWESLLASRGITDPVGILQQSDDRWLADIFAEGRFVMGRVLDAESEILREAQLRQALNLYHLSADRPPVARLYLPRSSPIREDFSGPDVCPLEALLPEGAPPLCGPAAGAALYETGGIAFGRKTPRIGPKQLVSGLALLLGGLLLIHFGFRLPLTEKVRALDALSKQQALLAQLEVRLEDYDILCAEYLRYGSGLMNDNEKALADRGEILSLVEQVIGAKATLTEFTLSGNSLTLHLSGLPLQDAGALVSTLNSHPLVTLAQIHSAEAASEGNAQILLRITLRDAGKEATE